MKPPSCAITMTPVRLGLLWLATALLLAAGDDSQARRQHLDNMSQSDKRELLKKRERFSELTDSDQQQLREVYADIKNQPDHEQLMVTLDRYSRWLKTLSASDRAQLLDMPMDKRVPKIRDIMRKQQERRFRNMLGGVLKAQDRKTINLWLDEYVLAHRDELLEYARTSNRYPSEFLDRVTEGDPNEESTRNMLMMIAGRSGFMYSRSSRGPTAEERKELISRLSREVQKFLDEQESQENRDLAVNSWIGAAMWSRMRELPDPKRLYEFARELDEDTRERLLALPREEMMKELMDLYNRHRGSRSGFRGRGGPGFGGRGGRGGRGDGGRGEGGRGGEGTRRPAGKNGEGRGDGGGFRRPGEDNGDGRGKRQGGF